MKTLTYSILLSLLFILPFLLMARAGEVEELVPPPIPLNGVREEFRVQLKNLETLLAEKKTFEFYLVLDSLDRELATIRKMDANRERDTWGRKESLEEAAVYEWLFYYIAKAPTVPLLSDAEYHSTDFRETDIVAKANLDNTDISQKKWFCLRFARKDTKRTAEFFKIAPEKLERRYLSYVQAVFQCLHTERKKAEKMLREGYLFLEKEIGPQYSEDYMALKMRRWGYNGIQSKRRIRMESCSSDVFGNGPFRREVEKFFIELAMRSYPRDAKKVHEILNGCGFSDKEKCRELLLRTVGKNKDTEYLFKGLPVPPPATKKK